MDLPRRNSLYRLCAASGVLLGVFCLMGAFGHFQAVGLGAGPDGDASWTRRVAVLLPGLILTAAGLSNIGLSKALWTAAPWGLSPALGINGVAAAYLCYLMTSGLPDHPVGAFLALAASHLVLLGAVRAGLIWPAPDGYPD